MVRGKVSCRGCKSKLSTMLTKRKIIISTAEDEKHHMRKVWMISGPGIEAGGEIW